VKISAVDFAAATGFDHAKPVKDQEIAAGRRALLTGEAGRSSGGKLRENAHSPREG
jgi:hypothetical protein